MLPDEAKLIEELQKLDERQKDLDRSIARMRLRQRHSPVREDVERARMEERALAVEMDRLMTRIRAVEGKLLQARKLGRH